MMSDFEELWPTHSSKGVILTLATGNEAIHHTRQSEVLDRLLSSFTELLTGIMRKCIASRI